MFEGWADADVGASQSALPIIVCGGKGAGGGRLEAMDSAPANLCQVKNSTFGQRFRAEDRAWRVSSALTTLWCGPYLSPAGRNQAASGASTQDRIALRSGAGSISGVC